MYQKSINFEAKNIAIKLDFVESVYFFKKNPAIITLKDNRKNFQLS